MTTLNDIPEHIWIEMIFSDTSFEMYVPKAKKTDKIKAAYQWRKRAGIMKTGDCEMDISLDLHKEFSTIFAQMNKNGSSEEHNSYRKMAIAAIKAGRDE